MTLDEFRKHTKDMRGDVEIMYHHACGYHPVNTFRVLDDNNLVLCHKIYGQEDYLGILEAKVFFAQKGGKEMKGLFIRGIDAELRQSLIDCGFEPVKQDVYFNGTMVTSDGKLWHPSAPFKPWNPDGKGWPECKVFNNASDFLTTAKEMLKEERK